MTTIEALLIVPFLEMLIKVKSFIPTLVSAFMVLVVGLLVAKVLHDVIHKILMELHFDRLADKVGMTKFLAAGGIKTKCSGLLSSLVYLVVMIMFLIMTVDVLGVTVMTALLYDLVAYIPSVISAVFVLVLGLILAKIIGSIIYTVVKYIGLPKPHLHQKISHMAIIVYSAKISIEELGFGFLFVGTTFHIWFAGLVLALAIAFGLGGRDYASKYLNK